MDGALGTGRLEKMNKLVAAIFFVLTIGAPIATDNMWKYYIDTGIHTAPLAVSQKKSAGTSISHKQKRGILHRIERKNGKLDRQADVPKATTPPASPRPQRPGR